MPSAVPGRAPRGGGGPSLRRTFLGVALVVVVPFGAVLTYFARAEVAEVTERTRRAALEQARGLAAQVEAQLAARLEAVGAAAEAVAAAGSAAGVEAVLRRLRQTFPDLGRMLVVDQLGGPVAVAGPDGRREMVADQPWFKQAATSTEVFTGAPRAEGTAVVMGLYAPVRAVDGQFRGVLAVDLPLRRVQEVLARAALPPGAAVEVVTADGIIVARHPAQFLFRDVRDLPGYPESLAGGQGAGTLTFADQEVRLAGLARVRPVGWTLAVGWPQESVRATTRRLLVQVGAGGAAAAVVGLGLALVLGSRVSAALARLRAAMHRLETGDVPPNVPVAVGGEVGALTEGFNRMLSWLRARLQEYEAVRRVDEAAGAALAGERSLDTVLPNLLRRITAGMNADVGALVIHEEEGLVTRAAVGFGSVPAEGVTLRRGQGLAGVVTGAREPVVVDDVEADYRVDEPYLRQSGVRSVVGVPVLLGDRVIGAVVVGYRDQRGFTEAEVQRLEAMARRAAQAIEHERALGEARRSTAELESRLAQQMEALQRAALEQAEARRRAQELEQQVRQREPARPDPAAEEARRVRLALQRTVSEELRTPLTALLELPRLLVDGLQKPLPPAERQQLEILHGRGEEILELIDNLVLLSGLHAGEVRVTRVPVNLPDLVHRVARQLAPRAATRGNRIETDVKPEVGQVVTDPRRLEQILLNLLATSIKYTEVGEIRVTCYLREPEVVITVADDGVGFTDEELERIFEPFLEVGPRDGRTQPGTGLHLTVAERLVRLLGGRIRVESEVDRGTWFTVSLPLQP